MPYKGDLGVPGVVLVLLVFVPAFALLIRRKWRLAAARKEEVRRLVLLASQEAARAEIESAFVYSFGSPATSAPVVVGGDGAIRQCAVCYSPTTTRCSRCKSVRYCSGKCQIIHWRQGHKDDCRPPPDMQHANVETHSASKATYTAASKLSDDISDNLNPNNADVHLNDQSSSDLACTTKVFDTKGDLEGSMLVDESVAECVADSSTILPSNGYTLSFPPEKPDTGSVSVKCVSGHATNANNHVSGHITSSSSQTRKEVPVAVCIDSFPSEVATEVTPVNETSCLDKLNLQTAGSSNENAGCGLHMADNNSLLSVGSGNVIHSAHQDMSLKSSSNARTSHGDPLKSKFSKEVINPQLELKPSFQFSFIVSSDALPKNINVPNPKDSCCLDTSHSVTSGRNNGECPSNPRQSKSASSVASSVSTYNGENHVLHNRVLANGLAQPIGLSGNTSLSSNGGHVLKSSVRRVVQQLKPSKPKPNKMLPLYDLYIKLYSEKVELQPCGLINCGNSCYANAVLQCLTFTRPLTTYFLQRLHSQTCLKKEWCFTCEFESLVVKTKQGKSPLSPIGILSQIHNIGSNLGRGKEEDAHEFLRYAIDAMQSACLKESGKDLVGALSEEMTLIELIFGGYLRSKIKCLGCQGTSERFERMMDLTVEIHGDISTLEEALARFTATEILDGENKYKCNRCKSYEKAKKKLTVLEAPNVLTIALKRFQSGKFGKLNKAVQFPEILNMAKYMSSGSRDKAPVYSLYAVVVHLDIMNAAFSGHYVCYVKNTQGKWYKIDDRMVKPVELDRVLSKGAYMLLYARCSLRTPSLKSRRWKGVLQSGSNPYRTADAPTHFDPPYRTHMVDSSSDGSFPSFSDEASCSTESTRDSTSTDDYSDYLFGDSDYLSWSPSRVSDDSNGYFSCSPSRRSSETSLVGHNPDFLRESSSTLAGSSLSEEGGPNLRGNYEEGILGLDKFGMWQHQESRQAFPQRKESSPFLSSDTTKQCRKLTEQCSNSRDTDWDSLRKAKSGLFMRRTKNGSAQMLH